MNRGYEGLRIGFIRFDPLDQLLVFEADGFLPVDSILDKGFYVQGSFYPIPRKLELYAATSQIYGDKDVGFSNSNEYLGGANYYITDSRNHCLNVQIIRVDLTG